MLMDDYSSVLLYNKQQNTVQSLVFFCGQAGTREKQKPGSIMIMMSLLNQCCVLSKDRLIAPLCSVAASTISTSWITQTLLCLQHVLGTGTL